MFSKANSELKLYVNQQVYKKQFDRHFLFEQCNHNLVGCNTGLYESATNSFYGQMGAIYIINAKTTPQQMEDIYNVGPKYMSNFSPGSHESNYYIFDGSFTPKIYALYNCMAMNNNTCYDLSANHNLYS